MTTLVFFLEEPSAKAMLQGILPKLLPENVLSKFIVFEGKQDLEKQLVRKMRLWNRPGESRFGSGLNPLIFIFLDNILFSHYETIYRNKVSVLRS